MTVSPASRPRRSRLLTDNKVNPSDSGLERTTGVATCIHQPRIARDAYDVEIARGHTSLALGLTKGKIDEPRGRDIDKFTG